ncbi:MAG: 16S rRNA (guanine(527)-N(7))-methyltransferase RsmG [Chloroflexi bacterium]|nr:MAG: 16S rRNA (guanine(527)-N(7))-methyltransferase RsmG [Chloroflexota bacterium]
MQKLIDGAQKLGINLSDKQITQFKLYYQELVSWNKKFNLTTITDYQEVQIKHFLDSLTVVLALTEEELRQPGFSIIDIGTGAGFPGIPLKVFLPQSRLVLLDSKAKKATFLQHIIEQLELNHVEVVIGRAEETAHQPLFRENFTLVISRAVASLPALIELALPFCHIGGKFVAQKKGKIEQEIVEASKSIDVLGGKLNQVKKVELEELSDRRYLVIIDKICPSPEKYPRRAGTPARHPIIGAE